MCICIFHLRIPILLKPQVLCEMLDMTIPIFLCLLWSLVEVHSQTPTAPYLTFNGRVIPNHAYVDLSLMMYPGDDDTTADISSTVICHTDLTTCCRAQVGSDLGNWSFPNGDPLPGAGLNNGNRVPMAERRRDQLVRLQRGPNGTISGIPSGIYRCAIETMAVNSADNTARETVYVGVYGSGGRYIVHVHLYDRCVGVQRHRHGLHIPCSTVKT